MGGTLDTACPQCGDYGIYCHSNTHAEPKEGVWCAFYPRSTTSYVFKSELDALRFARDFDNQMIVKFIEYGSFIE